MRGSTRCHRPSRCAPGSPHAPPPAASTTLPRAVAITTTIRATAQRCGDTPGAVTARVRLQPVTARVRLQPVTAPRTRRRSLSPGSRHTPGAVTAGHTPPRSQAPKGGGEAAYEVLGDARVRLQLVTRPQGHTPPRSHAPKVTPPRRQRRGRARGSRRCQGARHAP